ncbi:MAG: enoyl-CoA hydratase/isomerase family protein [Hyphomonadaceae bacterium]|nr:enoyl-CoA hydratase/isomerase family protein [Hyphomonadaceae bacterium]
MSGEIIARQEGRLGRITLNRPAALHALTRAMCAAMIEALLAWRTKAEVAAVLIDHAPGTRGFCAGGDIRMLAESGAGDGAAARDFFFTEYRLNHLLKTYPKPTIALMDGVTMGGGVGISVHGAFRVATARTTFAMPETGIGLFPDVGGGWFLPRLPGKVGAWLALTGARLKAADCLAAGVATHFVPSADLPRLAERLAADAAIPQTLAEFAKDAGAPAELAHRALIDRFFAPKSVEEIFAALEADGDAWATAQVATLRTKSPQTMKVSLRQIQEGAQLAGFAENMRMEYRIACRVVRRHDFIEGVRALIVEKDNAPKWRPETLEGVTTAMLDEIFAPLPANEEWTPL